VKWLEILINDIDERFELVFGHGLPGIARRAQPGNYRIADIPDRLLARRSLTDTSGQTGDFRHKATIVRIGINQYLSHGFTIE